MPTLRGGHAISSVSSAFCLETFCRDLCVLSAVPALDLSRMLFRSLLIYTDRITVIVHQNTVTNTETAEPFESPIGSVVNSLKPFGIYRIKTMYISWRIITFRTLSFQDVILLSWNFFKMFDKIV